MKSVPYCLCYCLMFNLKVMLVFAVKFKRLTKVILIPLIDEH